MGLFQKRPDIGNNLPAYTIGLHKTLLIVGLGNVGKAYDATRHNIGFACVDALAKSQDFDAWTLKKDLKCHLTSKTISDNRVIIIKPTTQAVMSFYKIPAADIVAVYDELDIDYGNIRTRIGGSAAGHNGVKSLIQHVGENFGRVRIGIGPKYPEQIDSADFVLGKFNKTEQQQIPNLLQETTALLSEYIYSAALPSETRRFIV